MSTADESVINCQICSNQAQKYTCPRCNIAYCSVSCYRSPKHGQCSETFYRECVVEEMSVLAKKLPAGLVDSGNDAADADVRRMYEILQRTGGFDEPEDADAESDDDELDSDDEPEASELADRMQDVDLNDANAVWSRLTDSERHEFENIVQREDISDLLPVNEPWWSEDAVPKRPLIEDLSQPPVTAPDRPRPPIYGRIAPFERLSGRPPAPCVAHNLANVLAAYALTHRYFNAEHQSNATEAASFLLMASANLRCNQNFDDAQLAVRSVQADAGDEQHACIVADVRALLDAGRSHANALAALSDVRALLVAAKRTAETVAVPTERTAADGQEFARRFRDQVDVEGDLLTRSKLSAFAKKIEYYLAYVKEFL